MRTREYIAALSADWQVLMSGIASIILAFWAAFFPPPNVQAGRTLLWIAAVACFIVASYRIWAKERDAREKEIAQLKIAHAAEIEQIGKQLDKLKTHKLTFEIDAPSRSMVNIGTPLRSMVNVVSYYDAQYSVMLRLYICFINSDVHPLTVKTVHVLLIKRDEDNTETEIPLIKEELYESIFGEDHPLFKKEHKWKYRNLSIGGRQQTHFHTIEGHVDAEGNYRNMLNKNCFLRVTMEAMNQPPYSLDFEVEWEGIHQSWVRITPRT